MDQVIGPGKATRTTMDRDDTVLIRTGASAQLDPPSWARTRVRLYLLVVPCTSRKGSECHVD